MTSTPTPYGPLPHPTSLTAPSAPYGSFPNMQVPVPQVQPSLHHPQLHYASTLPPASLSPQIEEYYAHCTDRSDPSHVSHPTSIPPTRTHSHLDSTNHDRLPVVLLANSPTGGCAHCNSYRTSSTHTHAPQSIPCHRISTHHRLPHWAHPRFMTYSEDNLHQLLRWAIRQYCNISPASYLLCQPLGTPSHPTW